MNRWGMTVGSLAPILLLVSGFSARDGAQERATSEPTPGVPSDRDVVSRFVDRHCLECHNSDDKTAGLDLDLISSEAVSRHPKVWEKVVRRLVSRQMPPARHTRPTEREFDAAVHSIAGTLDRAAAEHPEPGRTDTFRRLNRTEYQNAIRDLLEIDIDATALLPPDESSHGFDNITVGDLSPTLLDRYITAAQKISRLAVGRPGRSPGGDTFRVRARRRRLPDESCPRSCAGPIGDP